MIERLLLFGATGDLTGRFLLPALAELEATGRLPDSFEVIGAARQELSDDAYRQRAREKLNEHASDLPEAAREALLGRLVYRPTDLTSELPENSIRTIVHGADAPDTRAVAVYLALPPQLFTSTVTALGEAQLPSRSRIILEKPFGESLEDAVALNRLLAKVAGKAGERAVFRVDHALGMETVHNLVALRTENRVLESLWNGTHVEQVEILWEETLGLEGRAGYYDGAGALKDVIQNHVLQILALVVMELPTDPRGDDLHDRKVKALRSVRSYSRDEIRTSTSRARYTAGRLASTGGANGEEVPDYASEEGVDPNRATETYAEVVLELDSHLWAGTRFVLRAGKALDRRWKGVILRFRSGADPTRRDAGAQPAVNELRIGLDGPESVTLHLTGSAFGPPAQPIPLELAADLPRGLRPYAHVLLDVLNGDSDLSVRADEAEEAWRIVTPILQAWAGDVVPLEEYAAGSSGPPGPRHRVRPELR